MSLKTIVEEIGTTKAKPILDFARAANSFRNTHLPYFETLRTNVDKPLTAITDDEINNYFGVILPADAIESVKKTLILAESIILVTAPLINDLPANDVSD